MKENRKLITILISFVLMITFLAPVASAAEIQISENSMAYPVYINGYEVSAVNVYTDTDDTLWVYYSDLPKLFPIETTGMNFTTLYSKTRLKTWTDDFGYTISVQRNCVYLNKNNSTQTPPDTQMPENRTALPVYVNNQIVIGAYAYSDSDGNITVTYSDALKIFPQEFSESKLPTMIGGETSLKVWVREFGYTMVVASNSVYLVKTLATQPSPEGPTQNTPNIPIGTPTPIVPDSIPSNPVGTPTPIVPDSTPSNPVGTPTTNVPVTSTPTTPSGNSTPMPGVSTTPNIQLPEKGSVKVYVNGMLIDGADVYLEGDTVKIGNPTTLYKIFPETKNMTSLTTSTESRLYRFAIRFGYSFVQKGLHVYLNNNKQKPLEVAIGDTILDFPDQQPMIVSGRTLVPVRGLSEALGFKVGYNNGTVTITDGVQTLTLWINSLVYDINGARKLMDVAPQIINGRTMLPVRFVCEALGYTVGFNNTGDVNLVTVIK